MDIFGGSRIWPPTDSQGNFYKDTSESENIHMKFSGGTLEAMERGLRAANLYIDRLGLEIIEIPALARKDKDGNYSFILDKKSQRIYVHDLYHYLFQVHGVNDYTSKEAGIIANKRVAACIENVYHKELLKYNE